MRTNEIIFILRKTDLFHESTMNHVDAKSRTERRSNNSKETIEVIMFLLILQILIYGVNIHDFPKKAVLNISLYIFRFDMIWLLLALCDNDEFLYI